MFHQITKKIIALVTTVCLLVGVMVVPSAAADDTQMYLYNGVELPALPVWDRVAYPYAVLFETETTYYLYCFSEPQQATLSGGVSCYNAGLSFVLRDGLWVSWNALILASYATIWSNYDVYRDDGTLYMSGSVPVFSIDDSLIYDDIPVDNGPPVVETVPDSESIIEVLNSILEYDIATWNLLAYGTNRIRYIERYVGSILEIISPSEQETALKNTTADVVTSYTEQVWSNDGAGFGRESVTNSFEVLNNGKDMLDSGVSVTDFFGMFVTYGWGNWFSAETRDDLDTVPKPAVIDDSGDSELSTYEKNLQEIQSFVGGG